MFEPCHVVERLGHFEDIVPSLACILTKQHGVCGGKYLLKTTGNTIFKTLNFKMLLDAPALKNLCVSASSKAAYYSLSACYLKLFDSPVSTHQTCCNFVNGCASNRAGNIPLFSS